MNKSRSTDRPVDGPVNDTVLDRLVDGELSADERRALLAALERSPDGWRRCALAFVESQTLGEQLGGLLGSSPQPAPVARAEPPRPAPAANRFSWWSIAAAVLIAFGVGLAVPTDNMSSSQLAEVETPLAPVVDQPAEELLDDTLLVWANDDGGERHAVRAPLMDADAVHRRFGVRFASAPPADLVQEFERRGYRLSAERRFAPLYVGDAGRTHPIVVPVDDVSVVPIRNVSL